MSATTCNEPQTERSEGRVQPLEGVLRPKSIAVVGVTATPGTVPHDIFANILAGGYSGAVYPVAPGKREICGVPAFRYVVDIEAPVDLAVIVFPADVVDLVPGGTILLGAPREHRGVDQEYPKDKPTGRGVHGSLAVRPESSPKTSVILNVARPMVF
jgi:acetyltransferase